MSSQDGSSPEAPRGSIRPSMKRCTGAEFRIPAVSTNPGCGYDMRGSRRSISQMIKRRKFLNNAVRAMIGGAFGRPLLGFAATPVHVDMRSLGSPVPLPRNFIGLGYEMSSVATSDMLSDRNEGYVRLVRALGPEGVIRVGGIVADYTRYVDEGVAKAEPKETVITHTLTEQFAGFLGVVGWKAIWSLNLAQGSVDGAVVEAKAVASALGDRLLAFELGNEVENYSHGDKPFRSAPYSYERYRSEFSEWRSRILQAVPNARFAAPDTAASVEWVERMAGDSKGDVQLLTTHYYRGGQKQGTAEQLLHPDPHLKEIADRLRVASTSSEIPWRMCETNSFFGGGRPGVSDTFVGTLWTLDFMLLLAASGCAGVNIETGVNQLGFISSYSPIIEDEGGKARVGAPYYGMLAFATAVRGCDEIQALGAINSTENLSAYLLGAKGKIRSAVLINRSEHELSVSVEEFNSRHRKAFRLTAPSLDSTQRITLAGAEIREDGSWIPRNTKTVDGREVSVPRMSAVVLLNEV